MDRYDLTQRLKAEARRRGFDQVAVCPATSPAAVGQFTEWLRRGYAGQMDYLGDRQEAYHHPRYVLAGVRSLVMLTTNYRTDEPNDVGAGQGRISRYAWGQADYHDVIHHGLKPLADWLQREVDGSRARGVVDTAPLLERQFAQLAGLGWQGKNTLLLNRQAGSLFFLAALLTDVELSYDGPFEADHCGTCTACLDACPTDAFSQPYVLDARRCISYLTIELRGSLPRSLRDKLDGWLFGCDVCQNVCPWNHRAPLSERAEFGPAAGHNPVELSELLALDEEAFRTRFRRTPLWRAKRRGVLRNAAILLGSQRHRPAIPSLIQGLQDGEPLIRSACAWALGQMRDEAVRTALEQRRQVETDLEVREELEQALRINEPLAGGQAG